MKLLLFCLLPFAALAQKPYFQQEVNYQISATLEDVQHSLTGKVEFEYINNSPDTLREIWVHLWGNAFKNHHSAFCKQKLRDGDGEFYFADASDLGRYQSLDFSADGQKITWRFDAKNPDIAVLSLPKALNPGAKTRISTPFFLKIPASFSRLGHVETSYQMTQWYPKPAVYDHKGWHPMPYLDMGEFYAEFGSFDVSLTLPENYVVGATGMLQTPAEIEFLHQKEVETRLRLAKTEHHRADTFPASSLKMKTIRYTAERVHDFAWFADKRFLVLKDTARLASGKTVDCWAMFPSSKQTKVRTAQSQLWEKAAFYVRRSVEFYSDKVGEYPYPQATALHSALSAGGGMEYPMVTVIGNSSNAKALDQVITHEVGHNWFYGILASNERDHPFLDEGLNSYYENRYMSEYYRSNSLLDIPDFIFDEEKQGSLVETGLLVLARDRRDTPPDTHSNEFTQLGYGLQVYMKTAHCLQLLESASGTAKFDSAMQAYYQRWQFRHPYPEDLRAVLDENDLQTDWFFEAMQTQQQVDYKLKKVQFKQDRWELEIENKGQLNTPFSITGLRNGQPVGTKWFEASDEKRQTLEFQMDSVDAFEIDFERKTLDINRKNNFRRSSGWFPGVRPLEYRPLALFQNSRRNTLGVVPWLGWNNYDKTMLGLVLYNPPLPSRKVQYYLLPGYATGSRRFVGLADVRYKFFPVGAVPKVTVGVTAKTFDFDFNEQDDYYRKFYRVMPLLQVELPSHSTAFWHTLNFRTLFVGREQDIRNFEGAFLGKKWKNNTIHELRYEAQQLGLPNPYKLAFALETQEYRDDFNRPVSYLRSTVEWQQKFYYQEKRKMTMRAFAGYFLVNSQRNRSVHETAFSLNPQGFNDYRFDHLFPARSGDSDFVGRRVSQSDGGFKGAFGPAFGETFGNSNNFLLALNLRADLPIRFPIGIPLKPYFDVGYFDDATPLGQNRPLNEQLVWSGGLLLEFFKGGLEFYFPLVNSKSLRDLYCQQAGGNNPSAIFCGGDYRKMISWSLRINFSDPVRTIENLTR